MRMPLNAENSGEFQNKSLRRSVCIAEPTVTIDLTALTPQLWLLSVVFHSEFSTRTLIGFPVHDTGVCVMVNSRGHAGSVV